MPCHIPLMRLFGSLKSQQYRDKSFVSGFSSASMVLASLFVCIVEEPQDDIVIVLADDLPSRLTAVARTLTFYPDQSGEDFLLWGFYEAGPESVPLSATISVSQKRSLLSSSITIGSVTAESPVSVGHQAQLVEVADQVFSYDLGCGFHCRFLTAGLGCLNSVMMDCRSESLPYAANRRRLWETRFGFSDERFLRASSRFIICSGVLKLYPAAGLLFRNRVCVPLPSSLFPEH